MGDAYSLIGGIGAIFTIITAILAILIPIMVFLIQRNTNSTRQYLKRTNMLLEQLIGAINNPQQVEDKQPTIETNTQKPATVAMSCEHCGKAFKYGKNHSGQYKKCPGCEQLILLK